MSLSKYFQLRINLAAVGSAKMSVFVLDRGSCRRVASLQWSLRLWLMMTRSGSGRSCSVETQASCARVVEEILGWRMVDGPTIQGSRRIRNGSDSVLGLDEAVSMGSKVRRKEASPFSCLTVSAIPTPLLPTMAVQWNWCEKRHGLGLGVYLGHGAVSARLTKGHGKP